MATCSEALESTVSLLRRAVVAAVYSSVTLCVVTPSAAQEPLRLSVADAVTRALEGNHELQIQREAVALAEAGRRRADGAYDTTFRLDSRLRHRTEPFNTIFSGAPAGELAPTVTSWATNAVFGRLFATGAEASVSTGLLLDTTDNIYTLLAPAWLTTAVLDVRQPLMRGRNIDPARQAVRVGAADRERSVYALGRTVNETIAAVERAYWTLVAAREQVWVRRRTIALAEQQRADTLARLEAGTAAETDLSQPDAEIARRRGELFVAEEAAVRAEQALKVLLLPAPEDAWWDRRIEPSDAPEGLVTPPEPEAAVAQALARRPEVAELATALARADILIEAARDRLRPSLDLVGTYALRGLAGDRNDNLTPPFPTPIIVPGDLDGALGQSYLNLAAHRYLDAAIGVSMGVPIGNRVARADLAAAEISRRQAVLALDQLRTRIVAEVRNAIAGVSAAAQRVEAARAGREAATVQLQAERDRYDAGLGTEFFVLTRQNDLAVAEVAEATALADYRKAVTELSRATGSLAADRRIEIAVPGDRP
jgi:outer membrane protein TolC